jgi:hypothetical protein
VQIHDDQGHALDLGAMSDEELRALAYERRLSRAALVAVVAEMRRRSGGRAPELPRATHDLHEASDGGDRADDSVGWW